MPPPGTPFPTPLASPALRLVHGRWGELVDESAPVSYQALIAGAPQLLREWLTTERATVETGFGAWSLKAIEAEAFGLDYHKVGGVSTNIEGTVPSDPVMTESQRELLGVEGERGEALQKGSVRDSVRDRRRVALFSHAVHRLDREYVLAAVETLRDLVNDSWGALDANGADRIDRVLTALVSELLAVGFAPSFLRVHRQILTGNGAEEVRWDAFTSRLAEPPQTTRVAVVITQAKGEFWDQWPGAYFETLGEALGTSADDATGPGADVNYERFERSAEKPGGRRIVVYDVVARDHHAATRMAIRRFQRTADLVSAEVPRPNAKVYAAVSWHGETLSYGSRKNLSLDPLPVGNPDPAFQGYAARMTEAKVDASSMIRLQGALRAYRISREATYDRTGLTNLWTALEALSPIERTAPGAKSPSIIERVTGLVAPIMASFKARTLVDDVGAVMRAHGLTGPNAMGGGFAGLFVDGEMSRLETLRLLTTAAGVAQVEAAWGAHPIVGLHARGVLANATDGETLARTSYRTARRVDWQIRRLYRLRNEAVHGATMPPNAHRVLQHLLLYVSRSVQVLSDLILADNGIETIEGAAASVEMAYFGWLRWAQGVDDIGTLSDAEVRRLLAPPYRSFLTDDVV